MYNAVGRRKCRVGRRATMVKRKRMGEAPNDTHQELWEK